MRIATNSSPLPCRLLEDWSKCAASAPTAVLLVKACIDLQKTQPAWLQDSELDNEGKQAHSRVVRLALAAASLVGDVASSRQFFKYLAETPNSIDGQAFGLLMAAHGQVNFLFPFWLAFHRCGTCVHPCLRPLCVRALLGMLRM